MVSVLWTLAQRVAGIAPRRAARTACGRHGCSLRAAQRGRDGPHRRQALLAEGLMVPRRRVGAGRCSDWKRASTNGTASSAAPSMSPVQNCHLQHLQPGTIGVVEEIVVYDGVGRVTDCQAWRSLQARAAWNTALSAKRQPSGTDHWRRRFRAAALGQGPLDEAQASRRVPVGRYRDNNRRRRKSRAPSLPGKVEPGQSFVGELFL